jgi:hypothetical protein
MDQFFAFITDLFDKISKFIMDILEKTNKMRYSGTLSGHRS